MRVVNVNTVTSVEGQIIETAAQKLLIRYKPSAAATTLALALTEVGNVKLEAQVMSPGGGTHPLVYPTKILDLMEIAASNEGFVKILADFTVIGTVELSNGGSLDLGKDQISLSVTNMISGAKLEVYTIDSPMLTRSFIQYNPVNFQAGAPKEIDIADFYQICVPKGSIDKLELKYPNGRNLSYTQLELETICDEINEFSYVTDSGKADGSSVITTGSKSWYCIGVADAVSAKVSLLVSGNCYFVKNEDLGSN